MLNSHMTPSVAMAAKTSLTQNRPISKTHGGSEGGCTHCGNPKHVVENCFKLNGYPDWWESFNDRKSRDRRNRKVGDKKDGKVAVMMSPTNSSFIAVAPTSVTTTSSGSILDPHLNSYPSGNIGFAFVNIDSAKDTGWIIDSGATDHMTYDQSLLRTTSTPYRSHVSNANGVSCPVTSVATKKKKLTCISF